MTVQVGLGPHSALRTPGIPRFGNAAGPDLISWLGRGEGGGFEIHGAHVGHIGAVVLVDVGLVNYGAVERDVLGDLFAVKYLGGGAHADGPGVYGRVGGAGVHFASLDRVERERRAKIINAEGEFQAAQKLMDAAKIISQQPQALQLRYLQTLREVASENNSTILFPLPIDLLSPFMKLAKKLTAEKEE